MESLRSQEWRECADRAGMVAVSAFIRPRPDFGSTNYRDFPTRMSVTNIVLVSLI